jgi:hypothetical protein
MSPSILAENVLLLIVSAINCSIIIISYRRGGTAWVEKFGVIKTLPDGRRRVTSGAKGELIINAIWTIGFMAVLNTGAGFSIFDMDIWHFILFAGIAFGFAKWAYFFPVDVLAQCEHRSESYRRRLRRGYTFYWIFTVNFYVGVFLTASRLVHHYTFDVSRFFVRAEGFLERHRQLISDMDMIDLSAANELLRANVEFTTINRLIIYQLEPIVVFSCFVILVLSLIAYSPLKNSFHGNTRKVGYISSAVAVGLVVITAIASYYFQYEGFAEAYKTQLFMALELPANDIEHLEVVAHTLERLLPFSGLSGFFRIFTEEGGIFVIGAALTHLGAGIVAKDVDEELPTLPVKKSAPPG